MNEVTVPSMSLLQQIITIFLCIAGTMLTRFLPFLIFSSKKPVPRFAHYLGKALPSAVFAMLVVYCLKNVPIAAAPHAIPEAISIFITGALYVWKRNMFLSISAGTVSYMLLIQLVF